MKKFIIKEEISKEFYKKHKVGIFARRIGITRQTLSGIISGDNACKYPLAFTITKTLDPKADIKSFFEEI